jgi:hypothetical protein
MKWLRDTHFWKQINVKIMMELQIARTIKFTEQRRWNCKEHATVSTKIKGSFGESLNGFCFVISLTDFEESVVENDDEKWKARINFLSNVTQNHSCATGILGHILVPTDYRWKHLTLTTDFFSPFAHTPVNTLRETTTASYQISSHPSFTAVL